MAKSGGDEVLVGYRRSADLGPRALLSVWPDLRPDVGAVLTELP
ncbi:hypothetical protein ACWGNE_08250 [Streptomyces xiamenensis]